MDEAKWICKRFMQENSSRYFSHNEEQIKKKVYSVLQMIRAEHLDIPMVTMYRKYEFQKELDESDVWTIFNMDIEYGKYMTEKKQIKSFLHQITQFTSDVQPYFQILEKRENQEQLTDFTKLVNFLQVYYSEELASQTQLHVKKGPIKKDQILHAKKYQYDKLGQRVFLRPHQFAENLEQNRQLWQPTEIKDSPMNVAQAHIQAFNIQNKTTLDVLTQVC